jgi:cytochrome P450
MELDKLKSTSASSSLNLKECYHTILEQSFLGFLITFINAFVPLRWLPLPANWNFLRAKDTLWSTVRKLVQKRFTEVEAKRVLHGGGEENESRDLLTYMIEANLTSPEEALSREQIIEDVSL